MQSRYLRASWVVYTGPVLVGGAAWLVYMTLMGIFLSSSRAELLASANYLSVLAFVGSLILGSSLLTYTVALRAVRRPPPPQAHASHPHHKPTPLTYPVRGKVSLVML